MCSKIKFLSFVFACLLLFGKVVPSAVAQDDILDFLPAILSNAIKLPPSPAQWRITNTVFCPSLRSVWTVSDGENIRSSSVTSRIIATSNTSRFAEVEPGDRTFTWSLVTESVFITCGDLASSFTRNLRSGFRYEFTLEPNGTGGVRIDTTETSF